MDPGLNDAIVLALLPFSWFILALFAAPRVYRMIEFLFELLGRLADWWMSI